MYLFMLNTLVHTKQHKFQSNKYIFNERSWFDSLVSKFLQINNDRGNRSAVLTIKSGSGS